MREPQNRRVEIVIGGGQTAARHLLGSAALLQGAERQVAPVPHLPARYPRSRGDRQVRGRRLQAGIPTLEKALIANKIPLPAPGYRWPGRPYTPA